MSRHQAPKPGTGLDDHTQDLAAMSHGGKPAFRRIRGIEQMAAEQRDGDGISPVEERRSRRRERDHDKNNHSMERVAKLVERAVAHTLGGAESPLLMGISVDSVSAGRATFVVHVSSRDAGIETHAREIGEALEGLKGACRSEIAASSHRKHVPNLRFSVSLGETHFSV